VIALGKPAGPGGYGVLPDLGRRTRHRGEHAIRAGYFSFYADVLDPGGVFIFAYIKYPLSY
jgi:hypothetical protein